MVAPSPTWNANVSKRDPAVTSRMMSAVRNKNSRAELALRHALHAGGLRYRLHCKDLPGRPDIAVKKYKLAIFVDGDFWHGNAHHVRGLSRLEDLFPSRTEWWVAKIQRTARRDAEVTKRLRAGGWTVVRIWESSVLGSPGDAAKRVFVLLGGTWLGGRKGLAQSLEGTRPL